MSLFRCRQLISGFLILMVLLSCIPTAALADEALPPAEEPVPESVPEESQPEESVPEESLSEEAVPEEALPKESLPDAALPEESLPEETSPAEIQQEEPQAAAQSEQEESEKSGPGLYFGRLHAHSDLSDGTDMPEVVFQQAAQTEGLDFFALTDLSDSFDGQTQGKITADGSTVSSDWASGKAAAAAVTSDSFVGIFGYEMGWPSQMKIGHISTFGTPGFQSWTQPPYSTYDGALENYYEALAAVPGSVSQFNHPGTQYGTFCEFSHYSEAADRAVSLLEISFEESDPLRYYIKALDQGWHLAPSGAARTVVDARSLTEEDLLRAIQECRVYTTEDTDLQIRYSMDGFNMGSRLDLRHIGDTMEISVKIDDPTDGAVGQVELVTCGGQTVDEQTLSADSGQLSISLPTQSGYYFLRITQPDGDEAVTAPIWVDAEEDLGISGLTCETAVPVQGEEVVLALEVQNGETADFRVDALEVLADGVPAAVNSDLTRIPGGSTRSCPLSFVCTAVGLTEITVRLTGTLEGSPRTFEKSLSLHFHQAEQVTSIVVDGSHGNAGLDDLNILKALAMAENIRLAVAEEISAGMLKNCRFLLVSAPSKPFSDAFLAAAAEFAGYGGSLIICGQADSQDSGFHSAAELNRLLSAIGSTMRICDDLAQDSVTNGGSESRLFSDRINTGLSWCESVSETQVYRQVSGCTVDPGSGMWVVSGHSTTGSVDGDGDGLGGAAQGTVTLLACEALSGGGTVFAAGSLFVSDDGMKEPENIWDAPYANRTIGQALLGIGGEAIPLSTIQEARAGETNGLFRIRGYVTAGTSNPYNTFPDTLYLQDTTGGIAVTAFSQKGIQTGIAMEITGYAQIQNGNRVLKLSEWKALDSPMYALPPRTGPWDTLLDPAENGGSLVEVSGTCLEIYCREDHTMAGCLLEDDSGNLAKVTVEDYIFNGSDGENDLHKTIRKGRTIRAMGLLSIDEYGDTVIRARNCEEVVYVPPNTYWNPRTGDLLLPAAMSSAVSSLVGLYLLGKRKNHRKTPQE